MSPAVPFNATAEALYVHCWERVIKCQGGVKEYARPQPAVDVGRSSPDGRRPPRPTTPRKSDLRSPRVGDPATAFLAGIQGIALWEVVLGLVVALAVALVILGVLLPLPALAVRPASRRPGSPGLTMAADLCPAHHARLAIVVGLPVGAVMITIVGRLGKLTGVPIEGVSGQLAFPHAASMHPGPSMTKRVPSV